jgi:hypothetical protein
MPYTIPTNNCDPRLITVDEANGSTLTRADIRAFTRQDFEDQANKEVGMDRIIAQTKEARMAGVRERSLTDLLLSRHVALPMGKGAGSQSVIAPFRLVPRRNIVNANYFQIEAGAVHASAGTDDYNTPDARIDGNINLADSAWQITVNVGSSPWVSSPSSGLRDLEKYFLPGNYIVVEFKDAAHVAYTSQFKIIDAVNADVGTVRKATVTIEPNKSDTWWGTASADDKAPFQPTEGTVSLLANSVSDYESWGYQAPATNNLTLLDYWQQTIRYAFSYNEEYLKALESPLTSEFFKKFRTLPLAQQRKQIEMQLEKQMYNTVFYGDEINEYQTVETYTSLPQVVDPADSAYQIEFKSNTYGFKTQLSKCARVLDKANQPLDLDAIFEACYNLKRNRETTSGTIDVIDVMTDRFTASRIRDIMIKYYKTKFSTDVTLHMQVGQKITFNGATVFEYNVYELPDQGVKLAVFTDPYFDDRLCNFTTAQKSRGRAFWMLDWSDVAINVLRTNSAKRTTNVADELYRYVITPNVKQTMLNSKTIEVAIGDANRHQLIENFSDGCPNITVQGCDLA